MKTTRSFEKIARADGVMRYTRIQKLPMRVKLNGFTFRLAKATAQNRPHELTVTSGEQELLRHRFTGTEPTSFTFPEPWKMASGDYEFKTVCTGFAPDEAVHFDVEVDFSLWVF